MRRNTPVTISKTSMIALSVAALTVFGAWKAGADPDHAKKPDPVQKAADVPAATLTPEHCTVHPELELYAGKRKLDPKLVRAVAIAESNLDACAAARAGSSWGPNCYSLGYDYVPDPESRCNNASESPGQAGSPLWRYCGLGLMQTLEPPYTFWPALVPDGKYGPYSSGGQKQLFQEAQLRGRMSFLLDAKACSPAFNPFNPEHSACLGTHKLAAAMDGAGKLAESSTQELGNPGLAATKAITAYLALHYYYGDGGYAQGWIAEFGRRRAQTKEFCDRKARKKDPVCVERKISARPECYGMDDFIAFVRECRFRDGPGQSEAPFYGDYGSKVLSVARGLENTCGK